jgi:hypothetical protein
VKVVGQVAQQCFELLPIVMNRGGTAGGHHPVAPEPFTPCGHEQQRKQFQFGLAKPGIEFRQQFAHVAAESGKGGFHRGADRRRIIVEQSQQDRESLRRSIGRGGHGWMRGWCAILGSNQ